ncbi:hypothetical protein DFH09DRAFT_258410 [Mycena vulgaris]|nr:hypothetical protein DFH09DRAFT_419548 [Mycena vulgaris]KAJ6514559.1 hypothetical protein DFH09DRAFT_258410 [Mycena vulgaris]
MSGPSSLPNILTLMMLVLYSILFSLLYLPSHGASASAVNITFDDTNSTFFTFTQSWNSVTPSTPCPGCFWQLDASQTYQSTWHDAADSRSGSCTFRGSAIYLYGVDVPGGANISFTMNTPARQAYHYYSGDAGPVYHALLFHADDLDPNTDHTLTFLLAPASDGGSVGIIDYAVVTQVDLTTDPSSSKPPVKVIAGAVVAAVGGTIVILAIAFVLWRRKHSRRAHVAEIDVDMDTSSRAPLLTVHPFRESPPPSHVVRSKQTAQLSTVDSTHGQDSSSQSIGESDLEARIRYLEAHMPMGTEAPPPY